MEHFLKTTIALLFIFTLSACSKDASNEDSSNFYNELKSICITSENFEFESNTRSTVNVDANGVQFLWSTNDTVGIFPYMGTQAEFVMSNGAGTQTATFDGGGWGMKHSATYSAYYPYNFYLRDKTKIPVSYRNQIQSGNGSTAHLGAYDFMAAGISTPADGAIAFDMKHMGSLIMLQATLKEIKTFTNVAIKAKNPVFTMTGTIDLTEMNPKITGTPVSMTLNIPLTDFMVGPDKPLAIYFMMAPTDLSNTELDVVFSDLKGKTFAYQITGKNFEAGKAYAYQLQNAESSQPVIPDIAVDLGLPSGTYWADRNVGTSKPESYGPLFAWGETEPKEYYGWDNYKWMRSGDIIKYDGSVYDYYDPYVTLELEDDAAYVNMGPEWCMPTLIQLWELLEECSWELLISNRVLGYKVTGPNGNSIFLPTPNELDGYYWTSTLFDDQIYRMYPERAQLLYISNASHNYYTHTFSARKEGCAVRAVLRIKKDN